MCTRARSSAAALQSVHTGDIVTVEVLRRGPDGWDTAIVRVRAR